MLTRTNNQNPPDAVSHELFNVPETRLMLAVLQDALSTFQFGLRSTTPRLQQKFREVDHWFRSGDYDSPFSFESICSTLEIDPGCVREGLNRLRESAFMERSGTIQRLLPRKRIDTRRSWTSRMSL